MDHIEATIRAYREKQKAQQVENEILLLKSKYLDEGLRRLIELMKPLEEIGCSINADFFNHTLEIKATVHTDGLKFWYK